MIEPKLSSIKEKVKCLTHHGNLTSHSLQILYNRVRGWARKARINLGGQLETSRALAAKQKVENEKLS